MKVDNRVITLVTVLIQTTDQVLSVAEINRITGIRNYESSCGVDLYACSLLLMTESLMPGASFTLKFAEKKSSLNGRFSI